MGYIEVAGHCYTGLLFSRARREEQTDTTLPTLASASLAATLTVAGYLSALCGTPPNPNPDASKRYKSDRAAFLAGSFTFGIKRVQLVAFAYHALVTLFYPPGDNPQTSAICPHTENLSDALFTWNPNVLKFLAMIFVGAAVRLSAYGGLGRNFTFVLSNPDRLVTDGIYRYLQHPSYTGAVLVAIGMGGILTRWDTAAGACWMQPSTLQSLHGYGWFFGLAWGMFLFVVLGARVRDEEAMLKEQFGKEWEEWHRTTKRFIPGIV